jgi:hypothetical protein
MEQRAARLLARAASLRANTTVLVHSDMTAAAQMRQASAQAIS